MTFKNNERYEQSLIPTPTGKAMLRSARGKEITLKQETQFQTLGWFEQGKVPNTDGQLGVRHCLKILELIEHGPQYCWLGGHLEEANTFLEIDENATQFPRVLYGYFRTNSVAFHPNRFCMVRGLDDVVYVFPQSIIYWVAQSYCPPTSFQKAILEGKPVLSNELEFVVHALGEDEFDFYLEWNIAKSEAEKKAKSTVYPPVPCDLPKQYQGSHPKKLVQVQPWINFGDSIEEGDLLNHEFELPVGVDPHNLRAILGRQSLQHLGMAHMAYGYEQISQLHQTEPDVSVLLRKLFANKAFYDEFEAYTVSKQGFSDMKQRLQDNASKYFPYDELGGESGESDEC